MTGPLHGVLYKIIAVEVVAVIGCLARQQASRTAVEVSRVIQGARLAYAHAGAWPADEPRGHMPASLASVMQAPVRFDDETYQLDWDHWTLSNGHEDFSPKCEFVAVSFVTKDRQLADVVVRAVGNECLHYTLGDRVTFVIAGAEGAVQ
jgi:hypothetical protein